MAIVKPERPGGFNDYSPEEMQQRAVLFERVRTVYERFGFMPLETPMLEFIDVLAGEEGSDMRIWQARVPGERERRGLAMRFDHTVPLARYVAANITDILLPWRRYCFGPVFRGETTGAGRYHQFYQFDADIVGVGDLTADAEIIWMMTAAMGQITRRPFKVKWNSRKIINGLAEVVGVSGEVIDGETQKPVPRTTLFFRVLDKLDKIGWDGVREELMRPPSNSFDTTALELREEHVGIIHRYLSVTSSGTTNLDELETIIGDSPIGLEGVQDLRRVAEMLDSMGVPQERHAIDLSIARGLGYYTGIVFETIIEGAESFGSVYSGGRYDNLVTRFTGSSQPATGASIGFDRLFAVLKHLDELPAVSPSPVKVLVMNFGEPEYESQVLGILASLRSAGIPSELGSSTNIKGQLPRALKLEIPLIVLPGSRELSEGNVAVKNLGTRKQITMPVDEMIGYIKRQLKLG